MTPMAIFRLLQEKITESYGFITLRGYDTVRIPLIRVRVSNLR